jgi:hypothetical protein
MGWDWSLRAAAITGLLFIPRVNVSGEPRWWWCRLGITPDLFTRARWQSFSRDIWERVGGMDEGMRILRIQYLWYLNGSFTCRKNLGYVTFGFTSHPKEDVLRIFIVFINPSPRPVLNPRPFGPVASTLTTKSPKERNTKIGSMSHKNCSPFMLTSTYHWTPYTFVSVVKYVIHQCSKPSIPSEFLSNLIFIMFCKLLQLIA